VQRALMKCWKVIQSHALISGLLLAVLVIVLLVVPAYLFHWDWTGFTAGASQIEIAPAKAGGYKVAVSQPGKSLWDWLGLLGTLAIPVVVGLGAAWFTANQAAASDRQNTDNQREAALQSYIDKMSELLLSHHLSDDRPPGSKDTKPMEPDWTGTAPSPSPEEEAWHQARRLGRIRTLTVLRRLDGNRKAVVLQFLYESNLILGDAPCIDLSGADLSSVNLRNVKLRNANLNGVDLTNAVLDEAELYHAKLSGVNLSGFDLRTVGLGGADLSGANLSRTDLRNSYLNEANLINAKLIGADLSNAHLAALALDNSSSAALLNGADLTDAKLSFAELSGVNFNAAEFTRTVLTEANLTGANLMAAHFIGANLKGAKLDGADLTNVFWRDTIMTDGTTRNEIPFGLPL